MKETKYYIYTLTDPETKQIRYVGKSKDIKDRLKRHMSAYSLRESWTSKNKWLLNLKNKGLTPTMEIIDEGTIRNIDELEIYWISEFNSKGFKLKNETEGGDGYDWIGRKHKASSVEKLRINHPFRKIILQFDLNNNFIEKYNSLHETSEKTGLNRGPISRCCKGRKSYNTAGGYYFRFLDNYFPCISSESIPDIENINKIIENIKRENEELINKINFKEKKPRYNPKSKSIIHYDLQGNILDEYKSLTEAVNGTKIHVHLISNCCKLKKYYTVGGKTGNPTTFRYKGDAFDYIPYNKHIQIKSKKICKYDLDGNLIKLYDSINQAAVEIKSGDGNINSCCKRKINKKTGKFIFVKGFTWRYYDETKGEKLIS